MLNFISRKLKEIFKFKLSSAKKPAPLHQSGKSPKASAPQEPSESARRRKDRNHRKSQRHDGTTNQTQPQRASGKEHGRKSAAPKAPKAPRQEHVSCAYKEPTPPPPLPEIVECPPEEGKLRFTDLPIEKSIMAGIQDAGFKFCTPVQQQCLPPALQGRDITGQAQTGTGKTAAFLIAAFQHLLKNPRENRRAGSCRVLILAPTRELALQIDKDASMLGKYCGFRNLTVFGGMGYKEQMDALKHPVDILAGTPGRIIDYLHKRILDLSQVEILVIDEADRMLDMGFIPDVRRIVSSMPRPENRKTMFFSATLSNDILCLVDKWLCNPVTVAIEPEQKVTDLIEQTFYAVSASEKLQVLLWVLKSNPDARIIVFGNWKDRNHHLLSSLRGNGVKCEELSGDVPQNKRITILEKFRSGSINVLVATDVAARGIHVDGITHVVNYDIPERPEDYVHRIGRTGRAGVTGKSISLVCEYGAFNLSGIETYLKTTIKTEQPPEHVFEIVPLHAEPDRNGSGSMSHHSRSSGSTSQSHHRRPPQRRR